MDAYENLGPVPGQPHPVPQPVEQVLPLRHNDSVRLDSDENTDKQEYQKKVNKEEQPKNYKIQKRSIRLNQGPKNSRTPKSPTEPLIRTKKSSAHKRENEMDLYEPLGDQKNVVDAPKDEPMMPPMEKAKPRKAESVKPLRSGDDIDLISDTAPDTKKASTVLSKSAETKTKKKKQKLAAGKSGKSSGNSRSSSSRTNKTQMFFIIAIVVSILFCLLFLALAVLGLLHLFGAVKAIKPLMPLQC